MPVSDADQARVIELLCRDAEATMGTTGYEPAIRDHAARVRPFADDGAYYLEKVVEDFQQELHDTFVHTDWPRCPRHGSHPLWFRDGHWYCEQDGVPIAHLGALAG
jgi:hypothetical protein